MMPRKEVTSIRLTPEARTLLQCLAESMGLSQASVLETLVRERAKRDNIRSPDTPRQPRQAVSA